MSEKPERGKSGEHLDEDVADAQEKRQTSEPPLHEEESERATRATERPSPGGE